MIPWNGGKCPVHKETLVRVKINVWDEPVGPFKAKLWFVRARNWWKRHDESLARIVAYEVVEEHKRKRARANPTKPKT